MKRMALFFLLSLAQVAGARTYRLAVISDLNGSYGSKQYSADVDIAVQQIRTHSFNAVLSAGDMVAGQKKGLDYQGMWQAFHSHVTLPLDQSRLPLLPAPGNHDAASGRTEEREEYRKTWERYQINRFNDSRPSDEKIAFLAGVEQKFPFHYAVTMGPALLVALDATVPGGLMDDQLAWLERVLQKGASYPLKIVFGHVPFLPVSFNRANEYLAAGSPGFGRQFEALLERHHVQMFVNGHHHAYYQGMRQGMTRFVSAPLLGGGARVLLTRDRQITKPSPEGFLEIEFNDQGAFSVRAYSTRPLREIPATDLPEAISVPAQNSKDCVGCQSFPEIFFLDRARRSLYNRIQL